MNSQENLEKLRQFLITHELPKTDFGLIGVYCPYCGKSDRIRELEPPEDLTDSFDSEVLQTYTTLWKQLNPSNKILGICTFCINPLGLILEENKATTLLG